VLNYIVYRVFQFVPLLLIISVLTFAIIELPPGDFLTMYIRQGRFWEQAVDQRLGVALHMPLAHLLLQPQFVGYRLEGICIIGRQDLDFHGLSNRFDPLP